MRYASLIWKSGLIGALMVALFVGCKKEKEQNGPSLTVAGETGVVTGDQTLPPGTYDFRFKLIAQKGSGKDDADLKDYSFTVNVGGINFPVYSNRPAPNGTSFTIDTTVRAEVSSPEVRTYTFTVTDKNGKSASRSFKITFQETTPQGTIDSLISQTYTNQSDNAGTHLRYSPSSNPPLSLQSRSDANNNPSEILFVYWYSSSTQKHSVISPKILENANLYPSPLNWTVNGRNETLFRQAPAGINFSSVTYQQIKDAYESGTDISEFVPGGYDQNTNPNKNRRAECTNGRLIAFKQGNIYGLIRVDNATSGSPSATLSVKVARP